MSINSKLTWPKTLNVLRSPDVVLWEYFEDNAIEFLHQTNLMIVLLNHCMHKLDASCTCLEFCCVLLMYQAMSSREITSAIAFKRITSQTFCDCVWDWSFGWIHLCTEAALVVYFMYVCCYIELITPYLFNLDQGYQADGHIVYFSIWTLYQSSTVQDFIRKGDRARTSIGFTWLTCHSLLSIGNGP